MSANLDQYLSEPDRNGGFISDWAVQSSKGVAECSICSKPLQPCHVSFKKGKLDLLRHSESKKHKERSKMKKINNQPTLGDFLQVKDKDKVTNDTQELEISLIQFLSNHNIPPRNAECLVTILKEKIPDSEIVKKVQLSREKARYVTIHGVRLTMKRKLSRS